MKTLLGLLLLASGTVRGAPRVMAISVNGMVHPITLEILSRALDQAQSQGIDALLIRLNTPGGLLDATRQINEKIIGSPIPVITYVSPSGGRAASAGFFILEAGDVAAMAPGTNTGAASPVLMGQQMDPVMRAKVESDSAANLRGLAAKRGRNADLAQKAVLEAKSFTDGEALSNHLIDLVAASEQELFQKLDGREIERFDGRKQTLHLAGAAVVEYRQTLREEIISAIADPNIAFILLILGALGIYVEFSSPGLIAPGVGGAICVLLGLSALSVLPINWLGAALLVLALTLFVLEAKFVSHGILGGGGVISMVLGAMLLVDGPPELRIRLSTALAVALPFAVITAFLVTLVVRARANKVITGNDGMLGERGVAYTALTPGGKVFVHGEYWDAVSNQPLDAGATVRVVGIDGLRLTVEPIT